MVKLASENLSASFHPIPARSQLVAVAWLRWRLFANAFRRRARKGQVIGLVFGILLRLIFYGTFAAMACAAVFGAGFFAYSEAHSQQNLALLLAAIFGGWQFFSINGLNIAASGPSFDPSSLARFPLPFGRYLVLRTLFGLLTPSTIIGSLALLAVGTGITIADHALAVQAFMIAAVYAWLNIFFTRMIGAWLERWLANRRFREIFGGVMAMLAVGFQLVSFSDRHSNSRQELWFANLPHASAPVLTWLPPGLAIHAMYASQPVAAAAQFFCLLAWTALFIAIFAIRIHKQFLGEYLSEASPRAASSATRPRRLREEAKVSLVAPTVARVFIAPVVLACLRKEWLELRSSGGQLLAMATPLFFVFILGKGVFARHSQFFLPGAVAYVMLGLVSKLYNIFGADGYGVQVYLLAPVRLRDIVIAKNIMNLLPIAVEVSLAWILVLFLAGTRIALSIQISVALWLLFVIALNVSVGTLRSIQEPRKFAPGQTNQARTSTSRTSAFLAMGVVLGSFMVYVPVDVICRYFGRTWVSPFIFALLAASSVAGYVLFLQNIDRVILTNRDRLSEELCRV